MPQTPSSLVHRPLLEQISTVTGILSLAILVAWIVAQATLMAYRLYREPIEVPCSVSKQSLEIMSPAQSPVIELRRVE